MTEFSDGTDRELEKCMPNEVNEAMIVHHYGIKGEPDHSYDKWARRGGIEAWKKHVESIHGDRVKFSGEGVWTHAHSGDRKVGSYSSYNHSSETLNKRIDEAKKFKFDPLRFKKSEASKHKWDDWHGVSRTGYVKRVTKDKRAIAKMKNTEVNEVSKKLLGRYLKRAHDKSVVLNKATRDMSVGQSGEVEYVHGRDSDERAKTASSIIRRIGSRKKGIDMAVDKLTRESAEVNELSVELAKRYKAKAIAQGADGYGYRHADHDPSDHPRAWRRMKGISKAENLIKDKTNPITKPKVHDLRKLSDGEAYDHTQVHDHVKDGDVLHLKGGRTAIMYKAWPTMVHGKSDAMHTLKGPWHTVSRGRYAKSHELAQAVKAHGSAAVRESAEVKDAQVVDGAKREGRARKRFLSPMRAEKLVADKNRVDEDSIVEVSASKLGRYIKASHRDQEERKSSGQKWAREVRAQTGLHVGAPFDRKVYSSKHGREAYRNLALKKLTGKARVEAN